MNDYLKSSHKVQLSQKKKEKKLQRVPFASNAPSPALKRSEAFEASEHRVLWLQLALSKGIGPVTFWRLLKKTKGDLEQACSFVKDLMPRTRVEEEIENHEQRGFQFILADEPFFPQKLLQMRDCPPFLSFVGDTTLLNRPSLAIVGARNASIYGKQFAKQIAHNLGKSNLVIVSGLARGIDGAAHEGSLETGSLAVLAGGLDVVYPPENDFLYDQLKEQGGILTEMPLGTAIEPSLFPRRNRIIAGLSEGVVLIEAAARSGTLITAQYALESGKKVFSVPGFPSDPRSYGCNQLLRQGAILTESAQDVLTALKDVLPKMQTPITRTASRSFLEEDGASYVVDPKIVPEQLSGNTSLKETILHEMSLLPISVETLFQSLNCSLPHLLNVLTELESEGRVFRHANNDVSLTPVHPNVIPIKH